MTDIVERLRRINGWTDEPDASPIEAADEIERLRAALERQQQPEGMREEQVADWLRSRGYKAEPPA